MEPLYDYVSSDTALRAQLSIRHFSSTSLSSIGELFEGEIVPDERELFSGSEQGLEDSDLAFQKG